MPRTTLRTKKRTSNCSLLETPLRLFRVYSRFAPKVVFKDWAHDKDEAILKVRENNAFMARQVNVVAFPA